MNTVDMCRREKELTLDFVLNIDKWKTVNLEVQQLVSGHWEFIKFLNDDCTGINKDISKVPNDKGGIYVFIKTRSHTYASYIYYVYRTS